LTGSPRPEADDAAASPFRTLIAHVGFGYLPLALITRLPFAMMVVGVLTLVVSARGSVQLGGLNSAAAGLGVATIGPLLGAAADRFGQRPVLLLSGVANSAMLGIFTWLAFSSLPVWVMLVGAFLVGATVPQISPMSRSRLVLIISGELPPLAQPRVMSATLAYESAVDEVVFVFGPVIVGLLATTLGPGAPVIGAAVLTLIFVTAFAMHHTSAPAKSAEERAKTLAPAFELRRATLIVTVVGISGVGMFFGSMLTSLTSFMQGQEAAESAGLLYGVMGVGSSILALSVALLPHRFSLRARWITFALVIVVGTVMLQWVSTPLGMGVCLVIMGFGIGPTLVNLYSLGAQRTPEGRSATVMTMLGSGITVGQSLASAVTGVVADRVGTGPSLMLPLVAAAVVLGAGLVNWQLTSREAHRTSPSA